MNQVSEIARPRCASVGYDCCKGERARVRNGYSLGQERVTYHHYHSLGTPQGRRAGTKQTTGKDDETFVLSMVVAEKRGGINKVATASESHCPFGATASIQPCQATIERSEGENSHEVVHNANDECHWSKHCIQCNTCQVLDPRVDLTGTTKPGEGIVHTCCRVSIRAPTRQQCEVCSCSYPGLRKRIQLTITSCVIGEAYLGSGLPKSRRRLSGAMTSCCSTSAGDGLERKECECFV